MDEEYVCVCIRAHTHTQEYDSVIKKNGTMPLAAAWVEPEMIILSEVRQTKTYDIIEVECKI